MEVICPSCNFKGNIRDELIPDSGKSIVCPRCKTRFFVKKKKEPVEPEGVVGRDIISNPPGGSDGPGAPKPSMGTAKRSPILVCSVLVVTAALFYILGFISGVAISESDSESDTAVSESGEVAGKKTKSPTAKVETDIQEDSYSDEENDTTTEVPLSTRGGVEVYKLIETLSPLSELQTEKYLEENHSLKVYGEGTVNNVKEMDWVGKAYMKDNCGDDKYTVEIQLNNILRKVIIGLEMDDSEVMKIKRGDNVRFSGKLVNFRNYGHGSAWIYLYDGVVKKK
jgi:hypothetical protein